MTVRCRWTRAACWRHHAVMLLGTPTHLRKRAKPDEKPANWVDTSLTGSLLVAMGTKKGFPKK